MAKIGERAKKLSAGILQVAPRNHMQPTDVEFSVIGHTQAKLPPVNCEPEAVQIKTRKEWEKVCSDEGIKSEKVNFKEKKIIKAGSPTPSPHFVLGVVRVKKIGKMTLLVQYASIVRDPQARNKMVPTYSSVFVAVSKKEKFNRILLDSLPNFKPEAHFGELQTMFDLARDAEVSSGELESLMFDLFADQDPSFKRSEEYERTKELTEDEKKNRALKIVHEKTVEAEQHYSKLRSEKYTEYNECVQKLCGKNIRVSSPQE